MSTTRWKPDIVVRRGYTAKDHMLDEVARCALAVLALGPPTYPSAQRAVLAAEKSIVLVIASRDVYEGTSAGLLSVADPVDG